MLIKIVLTTLFILSFSITIISQDENATIKTNSKFTLENCVNEFNIEKAVKKEVGYQYWFIDKQFLDGRTVKMSVVAPYSFNHLPHSHPEDEIYFILEGTAKFILDSDSVVVKPYTSLYIPSESYHGIKNAGNTELKYLVIKKYADIK